MLTTKKPESHLDLINETFDTLLSTINTKQAYLEWVVWWKQTVSGIENDIRKAKANCKQKKVITTPAFDAFTKEKTSKGCNDQTVIWNWWYAHSYARRQALRPQARELYAMRKTMKSLGALAKLKNR